MTKEIFGSLLPHVAGLTHSVVEVYKISAVGMSTFTWTDANEDITFAGEVYQPWPIKRSKISFSSDFRTDQTEITVAKNWGLERAVTSDFLAGANCRILRVRMDNPSNDYTVMFAGEIGNIQNQEMELVLRAHTLDFLNVEIPKREYQVMCNWKLYDQFCTIDASGFMAGSCFVTSSPDGKNLYAGAFAGTSQMTFAGNFWTQGYLRITSGENADLKREVSWHMGQSVTVVPPFPFTVNAQDTFQVFPGCAHDTSACETKFNNLRNYGGFPFIPRQDDIL